MAGNGSNFKEPGRRRAGWIRLRYVQEYKDRHGRLRRYFRRPGQPSIALPGDKGSPEFMAAYHAAMAQISSREIGRDKRSPQGSVSAVIAAYYDSQHYKNLAKTTQDGRRGILEKLRAKQGAYPIGKLQRSHIVGHLSDLKPFAARNWLVAIRELARFAIEIGEIKTDPTEGIDLKTPRKSKEDDSEDGIKTWTDQEIAQFETYHPIGTTPRLALALVLYTAQRRSDVVRMGPQHVKDGVLTIRQKKTGTIVDIPLDPRLAEVLAGSPGGEHLAYLINQWKKPFSESAFGTAFRNWCDDAGLPKTCSSHGLRKAWCRRAAELGLTEQQIMSISGHQSSREVQRYIKMANRKLMARQAIERVSRESPERCTLG